MASSASEREREDHRLPRQLVTVSQAAFVGRLVATLLGLIATLGQTLTAPALIGLVVAGATGFVGLMRTDLVSVVHEHPSLAMVDLLIMAGALAVAGTSSPLILALMSSALLLGLWVSTVPGLLLMTTLMALYVLDLTRRSLVAEEVPLLVLVVPATFVCAWLLGGAVRRAVFAESRSQRVMRDAMRGAAIASERDRLAAELHDTLAKTVQGMMLTSAALGSRVDKESEIGASVAQIERMSHLAVGQLRQLMSGLRERVSDELLGTAVHEVVARWREDTGRDARVEVADHTDTPAEPVRYELLRSLDEALDNVERHAGPTSVTVRLRLVQDHLLELAVIDHGRGATDQERAAAAAAGHHGVTGIQERMARIGGSASWEETRGGGTTVRCVVHRDGLREAHGEEET